MIINASPVIEARQFGCILVPPIVALNAAELPDKANASILFCRILDLVRFNATVEDRHEF
jgi:hypothetical protein